MVKHAKKLKINGSIDHPIWYDIPCKCNHNSVETEFPLVDCKHCMFEKQEKSMPRECFTVELDIEKDGKPTGKKIKHEIKEITIHRGEKYQEIRGWKLG